MVSLAKCHCSQIIEISIGLVVCEQQLAAKRCSLQICQILGLPAILAEGI